MIDYILTDKDTHNQVEETIMDEEGTHRIRGTNDSDHNTIHVLATLNINIIHKPEKKYNLEKGTPEQWTHFNAIIKEAKENKDLTKYKKHIKNIKNI